MSLPPPSFPEFLRVLIKEFSCSDIVDFTVPTERGSGLSDRDTCVVGEFGQRKIFPGCFGCLFELLENSRPLHFLSLVQVRQGRLERSRHLAR